MEHNTTNNFFYFFIIPFNNWTTLTHFWHTQRQISSTFNSPGQQPIQFILTIIIIALNEVFRVTKEAHNHLFYVWTPREIKRAK